MMDAKQPPRRGTGAARAILGRHRARLAVVLAAIVAWGAGGVAASAAAPAGDSPMAAIPTSPNPARFRFDNHCVTIDGKDQLLFSGAFHYFRCPPQLWPQRFATLKAAGFNTLETYAAWNYHEPQPPANPQDFSKFVRLDELHDWLAMATDRFGFNVILRPGPYICAEWDGGGYPQWLLTRRPADYKPREWYRSDDPAYLAWCKHWYTAVAKVAAPFQITRRPAGRAGILFWQIENEYDYSDQPAEVKRNQLDFLAHTARDLGIEVPLITCMTHNPLFREDPYLRQNVIECRNTYPKYDVRSEAHDLDVLDTYQPDLLKMITELQGGWFAQVGGKLSEAQGFNAAHITHVTLFAWEHGFTVTNYYMGFGGTNFGDWAGRGLTTTYDYDAPVREPGAVTSRYFAVQAMGQFIADHGPSLARSSAEPFTLQEKPGDDVHVALRRGDDGSRYLFVRTDQRQSPRQGHLTLATTDENPITISAGYDLPLFGSKVLYLPAGATHSDDWYPRAVDPPARPTQLPAAVSISTVRTQTDPGPSQWTPLSAGQSEEDAGIFNRGFVFYRATVPQPAARAGAMAVSFTLHSPDWAGLSVDGNRLQPNTFGVYPITGSLAGKTLLALYENTGRPNFGAELEQRSGILNARFVAVSSAPLALADWREQRLSHAADHDPATLPDADDSAWSRAEITAGDGDLEPHQSAIYRTTVNLTDAQAKQPLALSLGRVDDAGTIYVNTAKVGECDDWSQAQRFDVGSLLHPGRNTIAVIVHNRDGAGGLSRGAWLQSDGPVLPAQWEISDQSAGVAGQWWDPKLDDSHWQSVTLNGDARAAESADPPASQPGSLLRWYRLNFSLPAPQPHVWVPWKLHLDAVGNGFLYLNGHALGRWWEVGPQRDFYLPECWLNFGGGQNVVAISLRPTTAAQLRAAAVAPYAEYAETR